MLNTKHNSKYQKNRQRANQTQSPESHFDAELVSSALNGINPASVPIVIIRIPKLLQKTGIGRTKLYLLLDPDSKYHDPSFPRPIHLGLRSVGWNLAEVENWLQKKLDERQDSISVKGISPVNH